MSSILDRTELHGTRDKLSFKCCILIVIVVIDSSMIALFFRESKFHMTEYGAMIKVMNLVTHSIRMNETRTVSYH